MRNAIVAFLFAAAAFAGERNLGSYIYAVDGEQRIHSHGNWEQIRPMLERWTGSYFWIRHEGREYLIRDQATLAKIGQLFAPMHAMGGELDVLHRKMRPVELRERDIERRMDAIHDAEDDRPLTEADRERLRGLREELRAVQAQLRVLEDEEERLDEKHEALEEEAEAKLLPVIEQAIRSGVAKPL